MFARRQSMNFLLCSSKIRGIKNIENEISLSFTNKILNKGSFEKNYVKAIYGTNGAGKSAIVHAYDIYRNIVLGDFPFKDPIFAPKLSKLINKKTKEFSIENVFGVAFDPTPFYFRHRITIIVEGNDQPFLKEEILETLTSRLESKKTIFAVKDGEVVENHFSDDFVIETSPATLRQNSLIHLAAVEARNRKSKDFVLVALPFLFAIKLNVSYGSLEDNHGAFELFETLSKDSFKEGDEQYGAFLKKVSTMLAKTSAVSCLWVTKREDEEKYRKLGKKLEAFLKLLKPDLVKVELEFKANGDVSYCTPVFHYPGYDIDYEFESTGVKKLCQLFLALHSVSSDSIVIVDEIDAGLHDIFFLKLVEYFATYRNCQLIMTTHNIGIMETLDCLSKSIDILTDDNQIVTWVKNGTSSPASFYKKGALGGVPFNLQSFDFAEIFGGEED